VNRAAKDWASEQSRVVLLGAPEKAGLVIPDEAKLAGAIKASAATEITPYVDTVGTMVLMDNPPTPGRSSRRRRRRRWHHRMGPVERREGGVEAERLQAGRDCLPCHPAWWRLAATMPTCLRDERGAAIAVSGVGKFNQSISGRCWPAGRNGAPIIGDVEEGLSGSGSPKDLETLFQLISLYFTEPRADDAAFDAYKAQGKAVLANQQESPDWAFNETLQATLSQNHFRARLMSPALIDEMNLAKATAFYKDRFADASDFTFVFVGNFTLDTMKPLVERYLASLPSLGRKETWKDVGPTPRKASSRRW
jgi:zinc protease